MPTQTVLKGLEHHALFLLLLQLCVLLLFTRVLGEVMKKLGQPPVVGELAAGVLLGPSVFGLALPELQATIFPRSQTQADLLAVISWIGVLFLLIVTGLETDIRLIREKGRTALLISLGGILIPFASGVVLGQLMPESFLVTPDQRSVFSLFMAVAMSISAVPVIAKVLFDLKIVRRDIGQLTLAAAMTDDTVGWILLSVVAGLASRGSVDVGSVVMAAGSALLFLLFAFTIGGRIVELILTAVDEIAGGTATQFSTVLVIALASAALTHELGIEAVLGAFVTGILAGESRRFRPEVGHSLELMTAGFVAPIFFASAGLKVDLVRLIEPDVLSVGLVVLAIACLGKFIGCYLGAWTGGLRHWERLAMGSGMNARGAMEIIVATVGLSLHVLTPEMYSVIVMVAIVTSLMAPPLLRYTLSKIEIGEAERTRLENEALALTSFAKSIRRVLVIAKDSAQAELAGKFVGQLNKEQPLEVTALYADLEQEPISFWHMFGRGGRSAWLGYRETLATIRRIMRGVASASAGVKVATGKGAIDAVVKEASTGYDLIAMVVSRPGNNETLFGGLVDRVLQDVRSATLVLRGGEAPAGPNGIHKILVPTIGTEPSKNALETASLLAKSAGGKITVVHVLGRSTSHLGADLVARERVQEIAHEVVEHQAMIARKFGADVEPLVLEGSSPESAILDLVARDSFDLIVMGTSLRAIRNRAFLGHRAETLLKKAPCSVAVVSTHST